MKSINRNQKGGTRGALYIIIENAPLVHSLFHLHQALFPGMNESVYGLRRITVKNVDLYPFIHGS